MFSVPPGCDTGGIHHASLFVLRGRAPTNQSPHVCSLTLVQLPHFPRETLIDPRISKRDCDNTFQRSKAMGFDPETKNADHGGC